MAFKTEVKNIDQLAAFIEASDIDLAGRTDIPTFGTNVTNVIGDAVYSWDDERVMVVDGQGVQLWDINDEDAWWRPRGKRHGETT